MGDIIETQDKLKEGVDFAWTLARIPGRDAEALVINDVEAVSVVVKDITDPATPTVYTDAAIAPNTVIYDTLQTDAKWSIPDGGYNFAHYLDHPTVFASDDQVGGHTYQVLYTLTTTPTNRSGNILVVRKIFVVPVIT